jgi:hypothetical protein
MCEIAMEGGKRMMLLTERHCQRLETRTSKKLKAHPDRVHHAGTTSRSGALGFVAPSITSASCEHSGIKDRRCHNVGTVYYFTCTAYQAMSQYVLTLVFRRGCSQEYERFGEIFSDIFI